MTAQFQFFQSLPHKKANFVKKSRPNMGYIEHQLNVHVRAQLLADQTQERLAAREGSWERTTEGRSQKAAPGRRQARQLG